MAVYGNTGTCFESLNNTLRCMFWKFGAAPTYQELPAMNVQLAPWPLTAPRPAPTKTQRTPPAAQQSSVLPPVLSRPAIDAQEPSAVAQTPPPSEGDAAGVRQVLRGLGGCSHADMLALSPSERQACLDRLAKAGGGPMALNLDRRGYAAGKRRRLYRARTDRIAAHSLCHIVSCNCL